MRGSRCRLLAFILWYVLMTDECMFTLESAAFCCEVSSSASGRHREHVNNSVLCSVAAGLLMTKRSNLLGTMLWRRMRGEKVTVCVATGGTVSKMRAEWLCVLSGEGPALSRSDYYHYFNVPCHLSGNAVCIHAGVWHIFSVCYMVGEERLRVYRLLRLQRRLLPVLL